MNVQFKDNSGQVLAQFEKNKAKALEMIGIKWQEIASEEATDMGVIDTGRFAASLSYVTPERKSGPNPHVENPKNSTMGDVLSGAAPPGTVLVGSNVDYAPRLEEGTSRMAGRPTVGNSILNYREDYREIIEKVLAEGFEQK